ncbi:MAG: histidine phosphatase family protein, partial [Chloroflexi bacterium]|nr:histidine phosphatase family protein [Chloroflexota bacterium]
VHNPENVFYARLPKFRLSEQGLKDAETTAEALVAEPIAAIYTSPMLRAKQTARAIARRHPRAAFRESRLLIEIRTRYQGHKWEEMPRHPEYYNVELGDETVQQVFLRMQRLMFRLIEDYPGQSVVCVSHGDPVKIIRMGYLGRPLTRDSAAEPDPAKGSITRFSWEDPATAPEITYLEPHTGRFLVGYWERVAAAADVAPGRMLAAKVEGRPVLVANSDGEFLVMGNVCGHMNAPLHQGRLEGTTVTCPLHESQYDLHTGKVLREGRPSRPLRSRLDGRQLDKIPTHPRLTYDVRVQDGGVFARIR